METNADIKAKLSQTLQAFRALLHVIDVATLLGVISEEEKHSTLAQIRHALNEVEGG